MMMTIEECRSFYAQEVRFAANLMTPGLVKAFAKVPRDKVLGPGLWQLGSAEGRAMSAAGLAQLSYMTVEDSRDVYHNVVVSLDCAKDINNGQPRALGRWIDSLALKPGERVYHLGCGVGYYTAIIAEVVGPGGRVVGLELQPELAERATELGKFCTGKGGGSWSAMPMLSETPRRETLCTIEDLGKYLEF
jgi:protein-L-isoaspartate(D-aspartate) O-methyltransferase